MFLLLFNIFVVFLTLLFSIEVSNIVIKFIKKWIKIDVILISIHLYVICFIYYLVQQYTPFFKNNTDVAVIIIGPMIGCLSDYFLDFLRKCKSIIRKKKSIKEIL
jgi:hypothetical protein